MDEVEGGREGGGRMLQRVTRNVQNCTQESADREMRKRGLFCSAGFFSLDMISSLGNERALLGREEDDGKILFR